MPLADTLDQALVLPEILAERCVHSRLETASCQACVDSCPQGAWVLDDASLGINTETCDGCGLCAAACPQAAIVHPHEAAVCDCPLSLEMNKSLPRYSSI